MKKQRKRRAARRRRAWMLRHLRRWYSDRLVGVDWDEAEDRGVIGVARRTPKGLVMVGACPVSGQVVRQSEPLRAMVSRIEVMGGRAWLSGEVFERLELNARLLGLTEGGGGADGDRT